MLLSRGVDKGHHKSKSKLDLYQAGNATESASQNEKQEMTELALINKVK